MSTANSRARGGRNALGIAAALALTICLAAVPAAAQGISIRGVADGGVRTFTASESFRAVLGSSSGPIFGGGVEAVFSQHLFLSLHATRFRGTGERVFVFEGETFELGIPTTVTVTPIEVSVGYRFERPAAVRRPGPQRPARLIPYIAGGIGWHRYEETSQFATDDENVSLQKLGYQALGGVEYRVNRWLGIAGEAGWSIVPDALGQEPNGVAAEFDETDLGGASFRVKLVIGR